ncbi:MAG: cytochrome c-type biogenesis protein CcmH [Burkholderiaceae bacterium]
MIGLAGPAPAWAASGAETETRLKHLSEELRCLVCQNQTLADSNAELAVDLRNQVKAMIEQGRSDEQIKSYLVDRYGQFVLYKPPVQRSTWLLWGGPFALLLLGLLVWSRVGRRPPPTAQAGARADSDAGASSSAAGTDAELDAARRLLDDR